MSTIDRDALLAWVRRWQSVREDMAKADHCDHAFNQSEADHFAALAALLEGQGWQDIATAPKDGTVILRPHRIWGAIDVRYAVEPLSVTTLTAGTKWEWLNGDYTTAWPDDAFLPFWQRLPPAPTEAAFPADLFDVETFERIAAFMGDTKR